jgi:endonuclease/exonuclease/phosphatase family metal-dependent hydrolase
LGYGEVNAVRTGGVRILSWNIHGAVGRNPRFDLTSVVNLVRRWDPDIVALQEVDSRRAIAGGINPFEFLPGAVGAYGVGAKSMTTEDGDYGQMLISRWPISHQEVRDISFAGCEPRRAIHAEVATPFGPLVVVATHLGLSIRERRKQTRILLELAAGDTAAVVMGDFNDWFWPGSVRSVLSRRFPGRLSAAAPRPHLLPAARHPQRQFRRSGGATAVRPSAGNRRLASRLGAHHGRSTELVTCSRSGEVKHRPTQR